MQFLQRFTFLAFSLGNDENMIYLFGQLEKKL